MTNPYDPEAQTYQTPAYEYPATYGVQVPQPYLYPSSHTPVPQPPKKTPKWVPMAIVAVVIAFLALGTLAVVKAPEKTNGAMPTASSPPFTITTAKPKLPKTDKQKLQEWILKTRANDQLALISTNLDNIAGAAKADPFDIEAVHSNCHDLSVNAQLLRDSLPTPFPQLTEEIDQAMLNYAAAGEACGHLKEDSTMDDVQPVLDFLADANQHQIMANTIIDGYK